jgi:hypothetical protein
MTDSEVSPKLGGLVSVSIYWKLETDSHNFRIFEKF